MSLGSSDDTESKNIRDQAMVMRLAEINLKHLLVEKKQAEIVSRVTYDIDHFLTDDQSVMSKILLKIDDQGRFKISFELRGSRSMNKLSLEKVSNHVFVVWKNNLTYNGCIFTFSRKFFRGNYVMNISSI